MARHSTWVTLIAAAIAIGIGLLKLVDWAAEYLWFEVQGYESVFWTVRKLKIGFFLTAFLLTFLYFWVNFRILSSLLDPKAVPQSQSQPPSARSAATVLARALTDDRQLKGARSNAKTPLLLILVAVSIALIFGLAFHARWETLLRFWWSRPYGETDPIFGRDIGFYLFEVPFLELVQDSVLAVALIAFASLLLAYSVCGAFRVEGKRGVVASTGVQRHLAANLVLFTLALAWGFYLDRFALLQSSRGAVYGAGYTDFNVLLPAIWTMIGATLALAAVLSLPQFHKGGVLALGTLVGYLVIWFVSLVIVPIGAQAFLVEPNELELETPFLRHNIALTRKAYQLDRVDERSYGALRDLTPEALARNRPTIDNIRLWDWRPLSQTFRQLQQIRAYYEFGDVDVDRYRVGDAYRQVMLAAREITGTLPDRAETWVNRHLQYTHGYGVAMSLTATKSDEGSPILVVKDLPPRTAAGLSVSQPAIYYGEITGGYRIVNTSIPEFDYPKGDENVYANYSGSGGVLLSSFWKKLLFAWHQLDVNILITSYVTPESRIQWWREVKDRVERLAPFLLLDDDPYPVVSAGQLYWIQDAYAVSSFFPYSEPHRGRFNYIRNSVKVVVDAYNGEVKFYVIDPDDPVLRVYREAMPALFTSFKKMPDDLRRHLRYPLDLFEAQMLKYNTYHMTLPQVFYNREDLWTVPREKYGGEVISMKPYYVLMTLPEEARLQFLLMTPLTPANRANMIAWMGARCDFPSYGQLIVYKFSKERLILGPIQIEAMIDQDTLISQQLSLWDQRGSRVVRGNLLVIPIEESFIYVEPVYLIAEDSEIPQLKRIIVSDGERLAMEPTLQEALQAVFGTRSRRMPEAPPDEHVDELLEAREALTAAEEALRDGDWNGFGRAMQELRRLLGE